MDNLDLPIEISRIVVSYLTLQDFYQFLLINKLGTQNKWFQIIKNFIKKPSVIHFEKLRMTSIPFSLLTDAATILGKSNPFNDSYYEIMEQYCVPIQVLRELSIKGFIIFRNNRNFTRMIKYGVDKDILQKEAINEFKYDSSDSNFLRMIRLDVEKEILEKFAIFKFRLNPTQENLEILRSLDVSTSILEDAAMYAFRHNL